MTFLHIITEDAKPKNVNQKTTKKNTMTTWMKDRNGTIAGQATGKREQVPSLGFQERKEPWSVICRSDAAREKGLGQQTLGYAGTQ